MELDKKIKTYEDCISRLEEIKKKGRGNSSSLSEEIENAYQQVTLLKIRKMMQNEKFD